MIEKHRQSTYTTSDTPYVIGLDYGSDSVRALLLDAKSGQEISSHVRVYPRWQVGNIKNPAIEMARQHPLDYIECTAAVLTDVVNDCPEPNAIRGIALDSTASTPCLINEHLTPLALLPQHKDNPDAMFVLWKDHTAAKEAANIRSMIAAGNYDYSDGCGKFYSPECYWAKMAHVLNSSPELSADAYTSIELCDWIAATLCGITDPKKAKLNERLSAIKQMWSHQRQAFPDDDFMAKIHPALPQLIHNMSSIMAGADSINGYLCDSWAQQIGLTAGIPVAVGNIDSYAGGVGAGIAEGTMILNLGTSACFLSVVPPNLMPSQTIPGVFAMAHDSILPNYIGIETGLSAFGDVFAWFKNLIGYNRSVDESEALLSQLTADAEQIYRSHTVCPIATDHLNGRRAPQPEPSLRGVITGLSLATSAPEIFYSLAEAAAFATRRVIDHLVDNGVPIERLVAIGGISKKSSFVMQMLADVLGREIAVAESSHACSRGSAIHAAVIAGIYHSVAEAADRLKSPIMKTYLPDYTRKDILNARYSMYLETSSFAEQHIY